MQKVLLVWLILLTQMSFATCELPEHKQFNFWLGEWDVFDKSGKLVGQNSINQDYNNCVIKETYRTVAESGYKGESLNLLNQSTKKWHQSWVDNTGLLLLLDGGWNGHAMELRGEVIGSDGKTTLHKIKWVPQKNGDVHQVWDSSTDAGTHWNNLFYGVYQKR